MTIHRKVGLALALSLLVSTVSVQASSIGGFLPSGDLGGGLFLPSALSLVGSAPNTFLGPAGAGYTNGDNPGTPAPSPNYVNLTANATALHIPIEGTFTVLDLNGLGGIDGAHEYFFTVTMNNLIAGPPMPIGPTLFEIFPVAPVIAGVSFDNPSDMLPVPTGTYNGPHIPTWTPISLWFGGPLGGGGELPPGGSATFTFSLDIPDGLAGNFGFRMTPNPEPTSLALAGLGMGMLGMVGGVKRWRNKKAGKQANPTA